MNQNVQKPENIRANATPTDGYLLSVDGKLKTRFESPDDATAAAVKLKQAYPKIQVSVYDATQRTYAAVETQEK